MFIAAPFTIAKIWNQPRCPTTSDWIKKTQYTYTMEYYSVVKKKLWQENEWNWRSSFKISQAQKNQYHMFLLICRI
jgi:hypothetical protein